MLLRGSEGWGEFSPFWDYGDESAARWLACALEQANVGWPSPVRDSVPVNVTVPAVGPEVARQLVLGGGGCRTAKVKVAQKVSPSVEEPGSGVSKPSDIVAKVESIDTEVKRLAAVRSALDELYGPGIGHIRIDANGAWTVAEAVEHLRELNQVASGLEYVEQPCATVEELAELRTVLKAARVDVLVAADESIRRAVDPYRVRDLNAADVVVLKVAPLGGVRACLKLASDIGLPVVVSSALESSVGLAAGLALAGALPSLPFASGLATSSLLVDDVIADPLLPKNGELPVLRADDPRLTPTSGIVADEAGGDDQGAKWQARLARVARMAA